MKRDIARDLFKSYKTSSRKKTHQDNSERIERDEPAPLAETLSELIERRDWKTGLAEGNLFTEWPKIVGEKIAEHSSPITLLDGCLTIQGSTTAWATQLRLMSPDLLAAIQKSAPGAVVEELKIIAPQSPSWRRGLRTIRGAQGPRDTYG
ncbi:MAG: DUF721 domain-containing protein [Actinobacteria bacterium]|nr:DUF721 domain-containing protein [Actinomycetota bacterium]